MKAAVTYLTLVLCESSIQEKICGLFDENQVEWRNTLGFIENGDQLSKEYILAQINQMRALNNTKVGNANKVHPVIIVGENNVADCTRLLEVLAQNFDSKLVNPHLIWMIDHSRMSDTWPLLRDCGETKANLLNKLHFKVSLVSQRTSNGNILIGQDERLAAQLTVMSACNLLYTSIWAGIYVYGISQLAIQAKEMDRLVKYLIIQKASNYFNGLDKGSIQKGTDEQYWIVYFAGWTSDSRGQSNGGCLKELDLSNKIGEYLPSPESLCVFAPTDGEEIRKACAFFHRTNADNLMKKVPEKMILEWQRFFRETLSQNPAHCTKDLAEYLRQLSKEKIDANPSAKNNVIVNSKHFVLPWERLRNQLNDLYNSAVWELQELKESIKRVFLNRLKEVLVEEAEWVVQQSEKYKRELVDLNTTGLSPIDIGSFNPDFVEPIQKAITKKVLIEKIDNDDWASHIIAWERAVKEIVDDPIDKINNAQPAAIRTDIMTEMTEMAPFAGKGYGLEEPPMTVMFFSKRIGTGPIDVLADNWSVNKKIAIDDDNVFIFREYRIILPNSGEMVGFPGYEDKALEINLSSRDPSIISSDVKASIGTTIQCYDNHIDQNELDCSPIEGVGYLITCPEWKEIAENHKNISIRVHAEGRSFSGARKEESATFEVGASSSSSITWQNCMNNTGSFYGLCTVRFGWDNKEEALVLRGKQHIISYTIHSATKRIIHLFSGAELGCHLLTIHSEEDNYQYPQLAIRVNDCLFYIGNSIRERMWLYIPIEEIDIDDIELCAIDDNEQFYLRREQE